MTTGIGVVAALRARGRALPRRLEPHEGPRERFARECPEDLRASTPVTGDELLDAAATLLALVQVGRGQLLSEADEHAAVLERAVLAGALRGHLDAWDLELIDSTAFSTAGRALVWLCIRRAVDHLGPEIRRARIDGRGIVVGTRPGRPWDVVRFLLVTVPRGGLELPIFAALQEDARDEVDLAEQARPTRGALEQLLAERRRLDALEQLRPVLVALDSGTPLPDTAARLREVATLFGEPAPASASRKAA